MALECHPDVVASSTSRGKRDNEIDDDDDAAVRSSSSSIRFHRIREAYETLTRGERRGGGIAMDDDADDIDGWSFRVWRTGDVIAQERTDVAGIARRRPVLPARALSSSSEEEEEEEEEEVEVEAGRRRRWGRRGGWGWGVA